MEKKLNCTEVLWKVLLYIYIALAMSILFIGKRQLPGDYFENFFIHANFIPFGTIFNWLHLISKDMINTDIVLRNVFGNVVIFIPLGIFLRGAYKSMTTLRYHLLLTASMAILIEIIQSLCKIGYFDIDAVILRIVGASIGFLLFLHIKNIALTKNNKQLLD